MSCPDYNSLVNLAQGLIDDELRASLQDHIDQCETCFTLVVSLAAEAEPVAPDVPTLLASEAEGDTESMDTLLSHSLEGRLKIKDKERDKRPTCPPGTCFDHYRIIRMLGRGGMGEVYLARDQQLGRKVALKVIRPDLVTAADTLERFLFEAQTTARFNHPHIVTIYGVGEVDGTPYVALEYLEGQNLADRMAEQPLSVYETLRTTLAIAQATQEAHSHDVLHRDLKPANVLIPADGRVRVVDFGLAYALEKGASEGNDLTGSGSGVQVNGTPAYMAPEQWLGEVTPKTDVWAIGLILYELISGKLPWRTREPLSVMQEALEEEPINIEEGIGEAPPAIADLVRDCLEKNTRKRPSAAQVVERLMEQLYEGRRNIDEEESPFRGLLAFAERHADVYFGREGEISTCVERLRQEPTLAIVGPSGIGKSSFIQAGVIPRLKEQSRWIVLRMRPSDDALRRLASKIISGLSGESGSNPVGSGEVTPLRQSSSQIQLSTGLSRSDQVKEMTAILQERPQIASVLLRELAIGREGQVLLLIDQMEECFTLTRKDERFAAFVEAVCGAADDPSEPVRVIFTLRDDFLGQWAAASESARDVLRHMMVLKSPDQETIREILTRPLDISGHTYDDPTLVDDIVDAVDPATSLPLVQFTARTLWDMRDRGGRQLRRSDYESIGGVEGALASHAEDVMLGLTLEEFETTRAMVLRLVTPERTRRVLSEEQLIDGLGPDSAEVLQRLTKSRLLSTGRADEDAPGETRVELAHESLIHTWPTLARWVSEGAEEIVFINDVTQAAELWDRRGRNNSELWQTEALAEALRAKRRVTTGLPKLVHAFLDASEALALRRRRQKRFWVTALPIVLAIIGLVMTLQKLEADEQRDEARGQKALVEKSRGFAEMARERAQREQVDALLENARADYAAGRVFVARAKLRTAAEKSPKLGIPLRELWWRLDEDPRLWTRTIGAMPYAVAWAPEKKLIAVGVQDRAIYLFEGATRSQRIIRGHRDQVVSLVLSHDKKVMVSGDARGNIQRVYLEHPSQKKIWKAHQALVRQLAFSPDDQTFASGSWGADVVIWDTKTLKKVHTHKAKEAIIGLDYSPDGRTLALLTDGKITLLDRRKQWAARNLEISGPTPQSIRFHPTQPILAIGYIRGNVRFVDIHTAQTVRTLKGRDGDSNRMRFSADGLQMASAGAGENVTLWDVPRGNVTWRVPRKDATTVLSIALSGEGKRLISARSDRMVTLYRTDRRAGSSQTESHTDAVYGVAFSPDGSLVASASLDGVVCLWNSDLGVTTQCFSGGSKGLGSVVFSPDGSKLAYAGWDGIIRVRNLKKNSVVALWGHQGTVIEVVFSADGQRIASVGDDAVVRIWNASTGRTIHEFKGQHKGPVTGVRFSKNGLWLATGGKDRNVNIWNAKTGKHFRKITGHQGPVGGLAFLDNDRQLATGGYDGQVRYWNLKTGKHTKGPKTPGRIYRMRKHPINDTIALASSGTHLVIAKGKEADQAKWAAHSSDVNDVDYSSDGSQAATVSDDGTVRIWNLKDRGAKWHTSALLGTPTRMYSHRGIQSLDSHESTTAATPKKWEKALLKPLASGVMAHDQGLVCIRTGPKKVVFWDAGNDTPIDSKNLNAEDLLATDTGCLILSSQGVWSVNGAANAKQLAIEGRARAIGTGLGEVLVATDKHVMRFSAQHERIGQIKVESAPTALTLTRSETGDLMWVLGYAEGNIELRGEDGKLLPVAAQEVPSSRVDRLSEGPRGTLVIGFGNGVVGLWRLHNGALIKKQRLHGSTKHLRIDRSKLYAATDLGAALYWNLRAFAKDRCSLLREIWQSTEVMWQDGTLIASPPPASDPCAPSTGDKTP